MPARLPQSKNGGGRSGAKGKLVRRPSTRISNQRSRGAGGCGAGGRGRRLPGSGMIVTMSVSQSDGITLQTPGRVATSRTRQVSTASALFDTSGMSIDVVCESTTENQEVVMNMMKESNNSSQFSSNITKPLYNLSQNLDLPHISSLYFLNDDQIKILHQYKVNNLQELLLLTLRQFLTIGLNKDQYGMFLQEIEKGSIVTNEAAKGVQLGSDELMRSEGEADEDDHPLVIDENIVFVEDQKKKKRKTKSKVSMRSLDEIEKRFGTIKNVKIPRSRAAITEVKSELNEIIADLNAKEDKLLRDHMTKENQIESNITNAELSLTRMNQEPVISTSKIIESSEVKRENVELITKRGAKRRTKKIGGRNKSGAKNIDEECEASHELDLKANQLMHIDDSDEKATSSTQNITTKADLTNFTNKEYASLKVNDPTNHITNDFNGKVPQIDNEITKHKKDCIPPAFTHIFVVTPSRVKSLEQQKSVSDGGNPLKDTYLQPTTMAKTVTGLFPFRQNPNNSDESPNNTSITVPQLSKCGIIYINPIIVPSNVSKQDENKKVPAQPESLEFADINDKNIDDKAESHVKDSSNGDSFLSTCTGHINNTNTIETEPIPVNNNSVSLLKERVRSGSQKIKTMKSFSATPIQPNFQPTVMLKKLPLFTRVQDNVDADSTTNCLESGGCTGNKSDKQLSGKLNDQDKTETPVKYDLVSIKNQKKMKARQVTVMNVVDLTSNVDEDANNVSGDEAPKSADCFDLNFPESPPFDVSKTYTNETERECASKQENIGIKHKEEESYVAESMINANCVAFTTQDYKDYHAIETNDDCVPVEGNASFDDQGSVERNDDTSKPDSPKSETESRRGRLTAQRRIDFDSKFSEMRKFEYDCDDVDVIAAIASTPLSPISCGIASPTIPRANLSDYTPAMEIDGHMSYPAIMYLLHEIDLPQVAVNKPDALDILLRASIIDPRLLKFNIKNATPIKVPTQLCTPIQTASVDPRRANSILASDSYIQHRQQPTVQQTPNMLLYGCLQRSPWYQSLMSTMKIQINQTISVLVRAMNNFQKIRLEDPYAVFDIFKLDCAGELLEILENLGLFVDVNGVISEKKNLASFAGRSYGCSSVVNSTYSFIQPVEPAAITVQHQHMRSYTGAPTSFQSPAPFISCYIDSPPMSAKKSEPVYQSPRPQSMPRRHCGLKGPYPAIPLSRSPVKNSPVKRQNICSDSEEESWDLDENVTTTAASVPVSASALTPPSSVSASPTNKYERSSYKYKHTERFNNNSRGYGRGKFFSHKRRY